MIKQIFLAFALLFGSIVSQSSMSGTLSFVSQTAPLFNGTYNVTNLNANNPSITFTLNVYQWSTATWSKTGSSGIWIGLGYGVPNMSYVDMTVCMLYWTNSSSDSFTCLDLSTTRDRTIQSAEIQDISSVTTVKSTTNS